MRLHAGTIAAASGVGAIALVSGETQGLAIDFTSTDGLGQVAVIDTGTPSNNKSNVGLNTWLTNTNGSVKWVTNASGLLVSKPANTVAIEYGDGGYYGLYEAAATNLALWASDLTNAAWTKSNLTTAKTATGPDGVANSATTCTSTAGNATALQAITSSSSVRNTSVWMRRRTGTGNIDLTQNNGSTWATQTLTSSWSRVRLAPVTAADPTIGLRIVTSGDAIDVAVFQHETGAIATSSIPTTTVAVPRSVDKWNVLTSALPFSATAGTAYAKFRNDLATGVMFSFFKDAGNNIEMYFSASAVKMYASGGTDTGPAGQVAGAVTQGTFAWEANNFAISRNGEADTTDVSGTIPSGITKLFLGSENGAGPIHGRYYKFVYVPRRVSDADLPTWRYADNVSNASLSGSAVNVSDTGIYDAFPALVRLPNGTLVTVYRASTGHVNPEVLKQQISTDDGQTWSSATTLSLTGTDLSDPEMTLLANGDVMLSYFDYVESPLSIKIYTVRITVSGSVLTPGTPVEVTSPFDSWIACSSKIVELSNGKLILPVYGKNAAATTTEAGIVGSDDGGATWPHYKALVPQTASYDYTEGGAIVFPNGRLMVFIRRNLKNYAMVYSDNPLVDSPTFSAPADVITSATPGRPSPVLMPDGRIFMLLRAAGSECGYAMSGSDGVSFGKIQRYNPSKVFEYGSALLRADGGIDSVIAYETGIASGTKIDYQRFVLP